jgi:hypothetical protein
MTCRIFEGETHDKYSLTSRKDERDTQTTESSCFELLSVADKKRGPCSREQSRVTLQKLNKCPRERSRVALKKQTLSPPEIRECHSRYSLNLYQNSRG